MKGVRFPKDFLFGTATSAHQIEGNNFNSDWWRAEREGELPYKSNGACDFWNKYEDDIQLMSELGYPSFRFSVEWSRIMPREDLVDRKALATYSRIVDLLLESGITPLVTLLHYTLPIWFAEGGGFEQRENVEHWRSYVRVIAQELGDRVLLWGPINELRGHAESAYLRGDEPPFRKDSEVYEQVIANGLIAHSEAYRIIKEENPKATVGPILDTPLFEAVTPSTPEDEEAAETADWHANGIYMETFRNLRLPDALGGHSIGECADFVGINYYSRWRIRREPSEPYGAALAPPPAVREISGMGWEVYPDGLYETLKRYSEEMEKPVIITENGISTRQDSQRVRYILRHLLQVRRALDDGIDVRGYFYWSFMDNFEWRRGFGQRFGLVQVDYETLSRRARESSRIYGRIARTQCIEEDLLGKHGLREAEDRSQ